MLFDTYFHLIWCYFMVVVWMAHGWSGDILFSIFFFSLVRNVALTNILYFYKSNNPCYKHVDLQFLQNVILHIFSCILYVNLNYFKNIT
jgi:hypothetical protein